VRHFLDPRTDHRCDLCRDLDAVFVQGYVEIGFVERQRFDHVGVLGEDLSDLGRYGAIGFEARRDKDQFRAFPLRRDRWHCRRDAKRARFVARRSNDTTGGGSPDRDGLAAQCRIVALFNRGVEGIHIHMYDLAQRGHEIGRCIACDLRIRSNRKSSSHNASSARLLSEWIENISRAAPY
jgi:hypothetical protein